MIIGKNYRITVLTDRLIRMEYSEGGFFVDESTQVVTFRDFPEVNYKKERVNDTLILETDKLILRYDCQKFTGFGLSIELKDTGKTWYYSIVYGNSDENLYGTGRTLDEADGWTAMDYGIFGKKGFAVLDDSESAILRDGEFCDRDGEAMDLYFFGYGTDYRQGLKDFFKLCGRTPMVPRYALGNWWSRYKRYSEQSYNELLDLMEKENIPLSVAVIDMDWHVTEVNPKYGTGWTGYTWNSDLFPDYKRFLKSLKDRKLATTLNLHPADGVRGFEDMYEQVASRMGADVEAEETVEFDLSDRAFRRAYFEEIMQPYEDDGVDFWWIDWQQGKKKGKSSVDPLFLLNHYHYEDRKRNNNRPMIFSRYAGPGSHRYPIGFSGDTIASWRSLAFQPYFTATASNIGYGWWSHDIGGHMHGDKDEERLIRWIEYGVFSPIMRLHSSNSAFFNKEPWNVSEPYRAVMGDFMRLRHRLLPYLYTQNYLSFKDGRMLIEPMYYECPESAAAYEVPNEYTFGTELIVGAITEKMSPQLRMARISMYIPKGRYMDIFNGRIYEGEKKRNLYRKLSEIPVLIKAGGIVPESLEDTKNGVDNPKKLRLLVGGGENGSYEMYEDDGLTMDYLEGKHVTTLFETSFDKDNSSALVKIGAAKGDVSLIPDKREYEVVLYGVCPCGDEVIVTTQENSLEKEIPYEYECEKNRIILRIPAFDVTEDRTVTVSGIRLAENDIVRGVFDIMDYAWCDTHVKDDVYNAAVSMPWEEFAAWLSEADISLEIKDAVSELF